MDPSRSALLTDLYQLTMAQAYWKAGMQDQEAVFTLQFRKNPFQGGYTLFAGLQEVLDYIHSFQFETEDLNYLMDQVGNDGGPLFNGGFINYLRKMKLQVQVDSVREGEVVFPNEPVLRVRGSLAQAQLLETAIINKTGFASLVATKASRVVRAAGKSAVLEFGLRRAQDMGGLVASRAAYIGGCVGTSNVLAGQRYGIPIRGTHAHSFVMAFPTEMEAFRAYADAMPNNLTFLVDTYGTEQGLGNAIKVIKTLKAGTQVAVRLDSGDLLYLSRMAREHLNRAGLTQVKIMASNDLDEYSIAKLTDKGAPIDAYGVGTMLATAYDQPALGMVYKLTALRRTRQDTWIDTVKLSEETGKVSTPGILQVQRFHNGNFYVADVIHDLNTGVRGGTVKDSNGIPHDLPTHTGTSNLLIPQQNQEKGIEYIRAYARSALLSFHPLVLENDHPVPYLVYLDDGLYQNRQAAIDRAVQQNKVSEQAA